MMKRSLLALTTLLTATLAFSSSARAGYYFPPIQDDPGYQSDMQRSYLASHTAAVTHRFDSHSMVPSGQVSSVSKTLASGSVSPVKRLISSASGTSGVLNSGQALAANQSLTSPNGQYSLVCQSAGNLVLYDNSTSSAYWTSPIAGTAVRQCIMQSDGNLVVYGNSGAVWASNTAGHTGAYLQVHDDRNVVIYAANGQVLGATNTSVTAQQIINYHSDKNYEDYGTISSLDFQNAITSIVNKGGSIRSIAFTPQGGFVIIYSTTRQNGLAQFNFYYKSIPQEAINELNALSSQTYVTLTDIKFTPNGGFIILFENGSPSYYYSSDTPQALVNDLKAVFSKVGNIDTVNQVLFPPQGGVAIVFNRHNVIYSSDIPQVIAQQFINIVQAARKESITSNITIAFTPQGGLVATLDSLLSTSVYVYTYGNIPQTLTTQIQQLRSKHGVIRATVITFSPSNDWVLIDDVSVLGSGPIDGIP